MKRQKNEKNIIFFVVLLIFSVTFFLDVSDKQYCTKELEVFFGFDYAVIVPIGLALWAFTTSLCILMLGKKDEYYMGITFSELYKIKTEAYRGLFEWFMLWMIIFLVVSTFFKFPITTFGCIITQLFIMVKMFVIIQSSLSKDEILDLILEDLNRYIEKGKALIKDETALKWDLINDKGEAPLILKTIKSMDMSLCGERETLIGLFSRSGLYQLKDDKAVVLGMCFAHYILAASKSENESHRLIKEWFLDNNCTEEIQKGIILSLEENTDFELQKFVCDLLQILDAINQTEKFIELTAWQITVCKFLMRFENYRERTVSVYVAQHFYGNMKLHFPEIDWANKIQKQWFFLCKLKDCKTTDRLDLLNELCSMD